jgi:hypothetical protein
MGAVHSAIALLLILCTAAGFGYSHGWSQLFKSDSDWKETPELRVIMTSTSDWARIMFDDFNNSHTNGIRIDKILRDGWFFGNDSDDRIDAGKSLTYVDVIYNATVIRTGDFVGFYKGDNDFSYTRMYVDLTLDVDMSAPQRYFFLVVAGAGVTTFQVLDKASGIVAWQDTVQGNSFTQYLSRTVTVAAFFPRQTLDSTAVLLLVGIVSIVLVVTNPLIRRRRRQDVEEWNGL